MHYKMGGKRSEENVSKLIPEGNLILEINLQRLAT